MRCIAVLLVGLTMAAFLSGALFRFRCPHRRTLANHIVRVGGLLATVLVLVELCTLPIVEFPRQWIGLGSVACALPLFVWAWHSSLVRRFGVAMAPDVPEALVEHGAFAFVRHPFYVSYFLGWGGTALVLWSSLASVGCVVMVALYAASAHKEERLLRGSPLAAAHADYRRRVGMFVPRLCALGGQQAAPGRPEGA